MGLFGNIIKKDDKDRDNTQLNIEKPAEDYSKRISSPETGSFKILKPTSAGFILPGFILHRCFKCRKKTPMNVESAKINHTARGDKGMLYGYCSICNHKMSRFCSVKDAEEVQKRG